MLEIIIPLVALLLAIVVMVAIADYVGRIRDRRRLLPLPLPDDDQPPTDPHIWRKRWTPDSERWQK